MNEIFTWNMSFTFFYFNWLFSFCLTGQTGQVWPLETAAVWHSRHYSLADRWGRHVSGPPPWPPSLPGPRTRVLWMRTKRKPKADMLVEIQDIIQEYLHLLLPILLLQFIIPYYIYFHSFTYSFLLEINLITVCNYRLTSWRIRKRVKPAAQSPAVLLLCLLPVAII